MEFRIQSLILPADEKHQQCRKLFYRGDHAIPERGKNQLKLGYGQHVDFTTYINACSYRKWKELTFAGRVKLHLIVRGSVEVDLIGYHKNALTVIRRDFGYKKFSARRKQEFTFEFPENDEQMLGFELSALSNTVIYGGYYTVEVAKKNVRPVRLAIDTTTCRKEEMIKKNVRVLAQDILDGGDEMSENFYIHVVDNGQSLTEREITGKHPGKIFLHPNINAGGSGGYARGMIECLHQDPAPTHVLVMDDDVLVLPESIRRTYNLLRIIRPEHENDMISGAMLNYENPSKQYEDIGHVEIRQWDFFWGSGKGAMNQEKIENCLENEQPQPKHIDTYAAWWYCCIPAETIRKKGLPQPFFIRADDIEYGVRSGANFITLNGICVWHMGFLTKYNAVFDRYNTFRNMLIAHATTGLAKNSDLFPVIWSAFRVELLQFNYNAAELIVRSVEDYLRGPQWLMNTDPRKILDETNKLRDEFAPLDSLPDGGLFDYKTASKDLPRTLRSRILMKLTWNGQRLTPKFLERPGVVPISFNFLMQPEKITMHTKLIAVNPYDRTGVYRVRDKKRFRALMRRWDAAEDLYMRKHVQTDAEYLAAAPEMRSEKFWRKYLEMDK